MYLFLWYMTIGIIVTLISLIILMMLPVELTEGRTEHLMHTLRDPLIGVLLILILATIWPYTVLLMLRSAMPMINKR